MVSIRDFVQQIQCLNRYLDLLSCLYYSPSASKSIKITGPFDDADLASHILRIVPRNWQDQCKLSGATVPRKLFEALENIEKPFWLTRIMKGPRAALNQVTFPRGRWSPLMKRLPRDVEGKTIVCFVSNMGAHTWPTTLQNARSTNPTAPQRRTSMGRMHMENLVDPRKLIKEEVAIHNYQLKLRN